VARIGLGFGMTVLARDPRPLVPDGLAVRLVPLPVLLSEADVVTLHARSSGATRGIVDACALSMM